MVALIVPTNAPAISGPPQGQWTYADWQAIPDDGNRYEIIDGVLYMTTSPSFFHQWIIRRLDKYIGMPAEEQGLAFAATAPVGLFMPGVDPAQPDFVLVLKENAAIINDRHINGVPDVIVEVISPGSVAYDERVKLLAYASAGVPEYGIVNPKERTVSVYRLDARGRYAAARVFSEGDSFAFDCLPDLVVAVSDLFAGSPDTTL
jgi:Uma2 family endonuclease